MKTPSPKKRKQNVQQNVHQNTQKNVQQNVQQNAQKNVPLDASSNPRPQSLKTCPQSLKSSPLVSLQQEGSREALHRSLLQDLEHMFQKALSEGSLPSALKAKELIGKSCGLFTVEKDSFKKGIPIKPLTHMTSEDLLSIIQTTCDLLEIDQKLLFEDIPTTEPETPQNLLKEPALKQTSPEELALQAESLEEEDSLKEGGL